MNLQSNDFELFDLPVRFAQQRDVMDTRWKELQRQAHPDRFAAQGAAAQRVAMQWSVRINEAYQRLKNPLARAAYLCELKGAAVKADDNTAMPAAFLMQQMEWREALDDAQHLNDLERLHAEVDASRDASLASIADSIDGHNDYAKAVSQVRCLMFVERFAEDVGNRIDRF